ncbi:PAS domain-containing protein [Hyphomonas sp. WL0036]|uniref:PAS domain-containing protein n=1 Tax=Hyphomonas sediminis TaxID=2866160 RepID=UPI001C81FDF0|nr:PAS domain-containing protein [Hyphomonas sediminis]MBY9065729.1 PAS domain-containing protein [Hyphomonas sediminis]
MTETSISPKAKRQAHDDPVLARALQAMTLCGALLGLVLYVWLAVRSEAGAARRSLAEAAATGQIAAEAELARIEATADRVSPLIAGTLEDGRTAQVEREARADVARVLAGSPVVAVATLDAQGSLKSVFGQMPADAAGRIAPVSSSRRAGQELLSLNLVPVSGQRAAYYKDIVLVGGERQTLIFVLRASAFQAALEAGAAAGQGSRAVLLNLDGEIVRANGGVASTFSAGDVAAMVAASGWRPVHADEVSAPGRTALRGSEALLEIRGVDGGQLQLAYLGEAPSLISVMAARRLEFMALFGASAMALVLALSLIQNEWRREDTASEDAFLVLAQARASCDLLDAGVIDWSVTDGRLSYSDGWAEMFSRGNKPASEDVFEWIARIHPDDQDAARETYQAMLDGAQQDIEHRIRIRLPSGLWAIVLERGRVILGLDGRPARIVLVQTPEAADGSDLRETLNGLTPQRGFALAG